MFAEVFGYKINYIVEGDGEPIVLLHGWGADHKCFTQLINLLKNKYKVYALDLPGFGESDDLKEPFTVDKYTDFVSKFIEEKIGDKKVILLGHSYGGRIIIKLNSRKFNKFNIDKNILIDAAGIKDKKDLKTKLKIYTFKTIKSIINILPIRNKKQLIDKYRYKFGSRDYLTAKGYIQDTLVLSVNEDLTKLLKDMKESLIIWGDKDNTTPLYMAKIMEKEIKNSGLVVLNGGHFSFIDDQYKFLAVIKSYLKL